MRSLSLGIFLLRASARNRLGRMVTRIKSPRYAVALLAGLAYFGWLFGSMLVRRATGQTSGIEIPIAVDAFVPFLVAIFALWWWLWGGYDNALAFSPAEVQFLFAAPLTRRQLVQLKLLKAQVRILFTAVFIGAVFVPPPLPWYLRITSLWLALSSLHMHQLGASLVRAGAAGKGWSGVRRFAVPVVIVVLAVTGVAWSLNSGMAQLKGADSLAEIAAQFGELLRRPIPRLVLFPFRVIVLPALAGDVATWARVLPGAVLVLLLHYIWVIKTDAAFEDAAVKAGVRRAERIARMRTRRGVQISRPARRVAKSSRLRLSPTGRPAVAILWKNWIAFTRGMRPTTVLILALGLGAIFAMTAFSGDSWRRGIDAGVFMLAGLTVALSAIGPLGFRYDLRSDLANLEVLRTYPLRGHWVIASEISASGLALSVFQAGLAILTFVAALFSSLDIPLWPYLVVSLAAFLLLLLPVNLLTIGLQNAMALLFPAWVNIGTDRPGGIEHMGQSMLSFLGTALLGTVAMIGPALVGAATFFAARTGLGRWALIPSGLVAWIVVIAEVVFLVLWLGRLYDDTDPVEAGLLR
ncbi:MAG: putative ABC exporter domain-containing protein [Gemmatimonadales bacterium]